MLEIAHCSAVPGVIERGDFDMKCGLLAIGDGVNWIINVVVKNNP